MMNTTNKTYPTHKVWFSDNQKQAGNGVEVGVVWPRKAGKQGGILKWNISPEILGKGVFSLIPNLSVKNLVAQACTISFSQKLNEEQLGRAVKVASTDEGSIIHWSIEPDKLSNGVLFVLEDKSPEAKSAALERPLSRFNARNEANE